VDRNRSFLHYYRDQNATDKVLRGAWYYSGDAGEINDDGQLIFIDRMSDMQQLADGTRFSPQYLESRLKFSPYIKDCMVLGGQERHFVGAIISIDFDNIGHWAEKRRIAYTTLADLSQRQEVCDLIAGEVRKINEAMATASRVKRFANLPKEFDPDEAEMTRTRKLRRSFVENRYRALVEAIYGDKASEDMEITVVYKDGRTAVLRTAVKVSQV
jgi:long-chain acyl-CoA synthetase